jgi:uncharacterized protein with gpF-like domain
MTRRAVSARNELAQVAIEQVESTRIPRLAAESVSRSLTRIEQQETIRDLLRDIFRTVGRGFFVAAAEEVKSMQTKQEEDEWFESVEAWLADEGAEEVQAITETTRRDIVGILTRAREDGLGSEEMARRLEDEIEDVNRQRGRVIARTETITASNKASHEGARSTGLNLEKEWVNSGDPRVRESHRNSRVGGNRKRIDEPFKWRSMRGSQVQAMYPGQADLPAASRINCRCVTIRRPID